MANSGLRGKRSRVLAVAVTVLLIATAFVLTVPHDASSSSPSWPDPVIVSTGGYNSLSMALTNNNTYLFGWEYPGGSATLFSSQDDGATWSSGISLASGYLFPNLCAWGNSNGSDTILAAISGGEVYRSVDSGRSFSMLSQLPYDWLYMGIGTNASWRGVSPDNDVYAFGRSDATTHICFSKSTNGGVDWGTPHDITAFGGNYPEVTSDGSSLYLVFMGLEGSPGYGCIYLVVSNDWGATWSEPKLIFTRSFTDGGANPCSIQDIGGGRALLTISDHRPVYNDIKGAWGTLYYSSQAYDVSGYVQGGQWQVDLGFCGKVDQEGKLAVGWLYRIPGTGQDQIRFTHGEWVTWSSRVTVGSDMWAEADLYIGQNNEYILTWDYPTGDAYLMRSANHGMSWTSKAVFGQSIYGGWPAMCGYANGTNDELIVVCGSRVAVSRDNGDTFQRLGNLPSASWAGMEVGTRASWLGGIPNGEIFVAGIDGYTIAMTRSSDGGRTWTALTYPCGQATTYWPVLVSDGSRLCLVYGVLNGNNGPYHGEYDLHIRYSDNWGITWSSDKMLYDCPIGEHSIAFQMQYAGNHKAILAFSDQTWEESQAFRSACVNYGYLDMVNLTYFRKGTYTDGGWIGYGVGAVLRKDGRFSIAYVENIWGGSSLFYTTSYNTGLELAEMEPWQPDGKLEVRIDNAVPGMVAVDGQWRTRGGMEAMSLNSGNHTVSFGEMAGYEKPSSRVVRIISNQTTVVNCSYEPLASVEVYTGCPNETIYIDSVPRNEDCMRTYLPAGNHTITFGLVADMRPHEPINITLAPGEHLEVIGAPSPDPGAPGPASNFGRLRVTTSPVLPATIYLNGVAINMWGIDWLKLAPGDYTLSFGEVFGYKTPNPTTVSIVQGKIKTVQATYVRCSVLKVATQPALPIDISVNGVVRSSWGLWIDVAPNQQYTVTCTYGWTVVVTYTFNANPYTDYQYVLVL